jgi:hypothetical protein
VDLRNPFPEDEHTEQLPRIVVARRRANLIWLVGAAGALVGAASVGLVADDGDKTAPAAVEIEAARIAAAIDLAAKSAHVQADGVAMTPMVRAALDTDAATMVDIARNEIHLALRPGETLEVFQIRGKTIATLLRWPTNATPVRPIRGRATRLENSGKNSLDVVAGSPIEAQSERSTGTEGEVAMSIPVDLALTRQRLSELVVEASLVGVGQPLALVSNNGDRDGAIHMKFPVEPSAEWKLPPLALEAVLASTRPGWITPARYTFIALCGMMLLLFLRGLRSH